MKKLSFLLLSTLFLLSATMEAQTIFPTQFVAPAEFNTGTVHISVLSRSERQMTTNFLFEQGSHNSWHYHPNASSKSSKVDDMQMIKFSNNKKLNCPEPILIIIGGNPSKWSLNSYIYKNNEKIILEKDTYHKKFNKL